MIEFRKLILFMKKIACLFVLVFVLGSCKQKELSLQESVGEINQITVIIEDNLWNGEVGDSIRKKLTTTVKGLPQEEPLFNLLQHTDRNGDDHFCQNRNILIVEKSLDNYFEVRSNDFALNQSVIYLSGKTIPDILQLFEQKADSIIKTVKQFEITESQKRIAESALDTKKIQQTFDVDLNIPISFELVAEDKKFFWYKKETQNGSSSLLVYEIPYFEYATQIENLNRIIQVRDSIGACFIQSQEDKREGVMVTEKAYTPYFDTISLAGKKSFQTNGTWELNGVFMSGPFINYTVLDKENNRVIVLEGFAYAPSSSKRNTMHELEAIIKSVKFNR